MKTVFEALKEIINPETHLALVDANTLIIKEDSKDSKLKKITIQGFDEANFFAFKLDNFQPNELSPYLSQKEEDLHKGCDVVIFTTFREKNYLLFCELKSSDNYNKYVPQLKNSSYFVDYIKTLLKEYDSFDCTHFKTKYFVFFRRKEQEESLHLFKEKTISPITVRTERLQKISFKFDENIFHIDIILAKQKA